jgi:peptidoglycan/LPS O-acetylase OafA/YrhL
VIAYLACSVHSVFGAIFVACGTALFVFGAHASAAGWLARSLTGRMIGWFGRHSYELYLAHIILHGLMRTAMPRAALADAWKPLWLALFLAGSAFIAWAVARFFSEPANRRLRAALASRREQHLGHLV